ncbi:MAG TPA: radical SAM protein [bacterium]|nr:radical SAM protein [bacterium]
MSKICLINPPTTLSSSRALYFPMALVCLGSVLKKKGYESSIIDFDLAVRENSSLGTWEAFKEYAVHELQGTQSRIFGISSISSNYPIALLLAAAIKERIPDARVILGGPQPSSVPEETLRACPWVDVIVIGEGEETLLDLVKTDWTKDSLRTIPGIAFLENREPVITPKRQLLDNLDTIPLPDFSLVPLKKYLAINPAIPLVEAGRGCPFLCSFCSTALMWERNFRVKTPARVLKEMRRLNEDYGLTSFSLTHDNFTTSHRYVDEFCGYFAQYNSEGFIWSASARPDTLNMDRLQALRDAGCRGLFFGIDSGSPTIQKVIHKNLKLDPIDELIKRAASFGIEITSSFVLGFPEETREDLDQTVSFACKTRLHGGAIVEMHPLSPLTGTSIQIKNASKLEWRPHSRNLSHHPISDVEISDFIGKYPALFSSFYSIPLPQLGDIHIPTLAVFYESLTNDVPEVLERILNYTKLKPLELLEAWNAWRVENYPTKTIERKFIFHTFGQFVKFLSSKQEMMKTPLNYQQETAPISA